MDLCCSSKLKRLRIGYEYVQKIWRKLPILDKNILMFLINSLFLHFHVKQTVMFLELGFVKRALDSMHSSHFSKTNRSNRDAFFLK